MLRNKIKVQSKQQEYKNAGGRTMMEMLGTLAIIGILSIGAIAGYSYGMDKYRANTTINEINLRMVDLMTQVIQYPNNIPNLAGTWGTQGKFYPMDVVIDDSADPTEYPLEITGIPKHVCSFIFDSLISTYSIEIGSTRYTTLPDTEVCGEDNTMAFYLNDIIVCQEGYTGLTCIDNAYCLPEMVCGQQCCTPEKSFCDNGQCVAAEDKECETNSDCGAGYWCQVGTKSDCPNDTNPINKCRKLTAKQEVVNGIKYAQAPKGAYTYFDTLNYCDALGMHMMSQAELRQFVASGSSLVETNTVGFSHGSFLSTEKSSCVHYVWTANTTEVSWSTDDNNLQNFMCCQKEVGSSCDIGFEYDTQTNTCVCATDAGCFNLNPDKDICYEKECIQCISDTDCADTEGAPYCDTTLHQCVECITHDQCANQEETPYCTQNKCAQCYTDEDCASVSGKPYCNANGICTACYKSAHCATGAYCKQSTGGSWENDASCFTETTFNGVCTSLPSYTTFTTSKGTFARSSNSSYTYMSALNFCEALALKTGENWKMASLDDIGCPKSAPDRWWYCTKEFYTSEISPKTSTFWATGLNSICNGWYVTNNWYAPKGLIDTVPKGDTAYLGAPTYAVCKKN